MENHEQPPVDERWNNLGPRLGEVAGAENVRRPHLRIGASATGQENADVELELGSGLNNNAQDRE
jgi:hypothetical protein